MDIQSYIASGVLEQYLLGMLSEAERQEVERLAAQHPEVQAALLGLEDALSQYAATQALPLPDGFLAKLMARLEASPAAASVADGSSLAARPLSSGRGGGAARWLPWLAAAALALLSVGLFWSQQSARTELAHIQDSFEILQADCDRNSKELAALKVQLDLLRDTATRIIKLPGTEKAPDAAVAVYFNPRLQKTYLDVQSLPLAATGKQYQLWALVDGQPIDLGVFEQQADSSLIKEVSFVGEADAFAITLEDDGGKPGPDLTQLYVIGNL